MKIKLSILGSKGIVHHILPLVIIVGTAITGVGYLVATHANSVKPHNSVCSNSPPTSTSDPHFPLSSVTQFSGKKSLSDFTNFQSYGYGVQKPAGYIADNHFLYKNNRLYIRGYPDPYNKVLNPTGKKKIPGVVGAGFDLNNNIDGSGGIDVCFAMTVASWQKVHLVILAWPIDQQAVEGEVDIFEGNPQFLVLHVHQIGGDPTKNAATRAWPASLAAPGPHLISARWDPTDGYNFYSDGKFVTNVPTSVASTPTTPHHLSIQMQDMPLRETSSQVATIYWAATYSYNQYPANSSLKH